MLEVPDAPGQGLERCLLSVSQKVSSNAFCSPGPRVVQSPKQSRIMLPTIHKEHIVFSYRVRSGMIQCSDVPYFLLFQLFIYFF